MDLHEQGKPYWEIAQRFHQARKTMPQLLPVALRDMARLCNTSTSEAVRKRVIGFISQHQEKPPRGTPDNDGPRLA